MTYLQIAQWERIAIRNHSESRYQADNPLELVDNCNKTRQNFVDSDHDNQQHPSQPYSAQTSATCDAEYMLIERYSKIAICGC
jgi:hypothetical protein